MLNKLYKIRQVDTICLIDKERISVFFNYPLFILQNSECTVHTHSGWKLDKIPMCLILIQFIIIALEWTIHLRWHEVWYISNQFVWHDFFFHTSSSNLGLLKKILIMQTFRPSKFVIPNYTICISTSLQQNWMRRLVAIVIISTNNLS